MKVNNWPEVSLGDLASSARNAIVGGPFGSNLVSNDYTSDGVPVIRGQNMQGRWIGGDFVFVSKEKAMSLSANLTRPGDLVFTQRGTLGQVSMVPTGGAEYYVVSQSQMKATIDSSKADVRFLYYFFISPEQQDWIRSNSIQTGVPHTNLGILKKHAIPLPTLREQTEIADVLSSLDDKIEQNRRTGSKLEGLARAVFKAWFVDFEPVKAKAAGATAFPGMPPETFATLPTRLTDSPLGPVPEGWEVATLDDVLQLQRGFDLPKSQRVEGPYPIYAASGVNGWHNEWRVKGPGVTTGRSGVLGNVLFADRDFWPLNTSLWVKEYKRSNPWHAYYLLQTVGLNRFNAGSAVPTLNRNHLRAIEVVKASEDLLNAFATICGRLFELQQHLDAESAKLAALRDYLLPRLLSGRVRVEAGRD